MHKIGYIMLVLMLLISFGCGGKNIEGDESAEELYQQAMEELNKEGGFPYLFTGADYDQIFKSLKEIQLRYTYSPYATLAELRTADAYFRQEEYEQAAVGYEEFLKNHPSHEETPYATYRLALSHYELKQSPDRDPAHTRQALQWFNIFVDKYPDSPLLPEAEERIARCRKILAEREIYIGKFYSKRKNYKAAAARFREVVEHYDNTNKLEEALFLMGESYMKAGEMEQAKQALRRIVDEFPRAKYSDDAAELLSEIERKQASKT